MKTKRKESVKSLFKWLSIFSLIAVFIAVVPSCKGKTKASDSSVEKVTGSSLSEGNADSIAFRGQTVPPDAPSPPPPPPPLPYNVINADTVWYRVDEFPVFPGGAAALSKYLGETIVYPEASKKKNIQGRVVVGFVLTKECKVIDAKIVAGISQDCDQEALRVVNSLPLFEKPAKVNGRPVAYHFTLPVHYTLN